MAVRTSNPPTVPGPRTPFALYPELLEPSSAHEAFRWRAGIRRNADSHSRYTSEYQRQYRPMSAKIPPTREEVREAHPMLSDRDGTRKEVPTQSIEPVRELIQVNHPMVNVREELSADRPLVDLRKVYHEVEGTENVSKDVERLVATSPNKPIEERQKRAAKRRDKKGAKPARKDPLPPPPLSEYQSQFQAWAPHPQEKVTNINTVPYAPKKELSADIRPSTPTAPDIRPSRYIQRSPRRWSSEYRSNFSAHSPPHTPAVSDGTSPWYRMLMELRERARAYRDRGRSSTLEHLQLSYRPSEVSASSRLPSTRAITPPLQTIVPPLAMEIDTPTQQQDSPLEQEQHTLNCSRDTATQVTSRSILQPTYTANIAPTSITVPSSNTTHANLASTSHLENSLSKLRLATPGPTRKLSQTEPPNSSHLQRALSNTMRASVENHKSISPIPPIPRIPHEAERARTAVPPIDINRIHYSPSPPRPHGSPTYLPAPLPRTALSQTDPSLQAQLFRYKQAAPPPDADQVSVASVNSLASHTLEKARMRQEFWK